MKPVSNRLLPLLMGVCLFPLLASMLVGLAAAGTQTQDATITANYVAGETGLPDLLEGQAPPNMELAAYVNGRLLDVTNANASGEYSFDMPVMPPRRNEMIVLPTALDPSTLALMYDPNGFERVTMPPADLFLEAPFIAAATRQAGGLEIYGSAIPFTQLDIFAEACSSANPHVTVTPSDTNNRIDDEGSFIALLPFAVDASLPARYCVRMTPLVGDPPSEPQEYFVAAPVADPARGEGLWSRSIEMQFTPDAVRLVFSVEMPGQTLVYKNLASGGMSELQFIAYVFGEVSLNTYVDPRKLAWRQEKEAGSERVRVLIESQPLEYLIPADTATTFQLNMDPVGDTKAPPYSTGDSVTAKLVGVRVLETEPPATSGNASVQTWRGILAEVSQFTLKVSRTPQPLANPVGRKNLLKTIANVVTSLDIVPSAFLRDTLEGQIVDVLPFRAPADAQAQVYDYFSAIYRADPFVNAEEPKQTFQSVLQDLPGRPPSWLTSLLFGCIWLIPATLTLWALRAAPATLPSVTGQAPSAQRTRADLARLAAGAFALTVLGLDWFEGLGRLGLRREIYLDWQAAGHLVFLLLFLPLPRWIGWLSGRPAHWMLVSLLSAPLAAIAARFLLVSLPDGWASALLTALPLLSFLCLLWLALNVGKEERKPPSLSISILALAFILGLSMPVQSLPLITQLSGTIGVSALGAALARPLFSLTLLLGVVMALRGELNVPLGAELRPLVRGLGRVLLVGFAVGVTPAWGFVPLAVFGGLAFFEWLLPRTPLIASDIAEAFIKEHQKDGVKNILKINRQTRWWRANVSSAQKLARENKLDEVEHENKRDKYEGDKNALEKPDYLNAKEYTLRDLAFNFGVGKSHWENLQTSLAWGLILAAPLVVLQGWPLALEAIEKAGTYPFLSTSVRLAALMAQYLAAAAFLGYFFPYLRGRNGLEKGGWLSAAIILSFLPYHLIHADSVTQWLVIAIWAGSMLAYNLIISLLAFDIRTLLYFKQGGTSLSDLYDFGELAAYLTGTGAPLVMTIFTAVTNQMDDWVPALLQVVFPSFTLSGSQFQLLQVLIDLAQRIASNIK